MENIQFEKRHLVQYSLYEPNGKVCSSSIQKQTSVSESWLIFDLNFELLNIHNSSIEPEEMEKHDELSFAAMSCAIVLRACSAPKIVSEET